jgi:hypothetical protein
MLFLNNILSSVSNKQRKMVIYLDTSQTFHIPWSDIHFILHSAVGNKYSFLIFTQLGKEKSLDHQLLWHDRICGSIACALTAACCFMSNTMVR